MTSRFKEINISTWPRRTTYEFFKEFEDPFFNITANIDVTELRRSCREKALAFSLAALFYSQKAVNSIPEFRTRLMDGKVVEFETVESTQTILQDDETFSFCHFKNAPTVERFVAEGMAAVDKYKKLNTFDVETERLDLVYHSVIPWISFTSFKHATRTGRQLSCPRIVFGRVFSAGESEMMPVSVEVHHALADGIHVGKYFGELQQLVNAL